ncbi:hypothetical protein QCA50_004873 [Cerrena zonata]|uniref:Uncharacterized protein n=1 Tax=Cerrena zonata TaxID=2478898 RepID=A0AAW0GK02_9APHY
MFSRIFQQRSTRVDQQTFAKNSLLLLKNYNRLTNSAGARIPKGLVDTTARGGYSITGSKPQTPHEMAAEYFLFDWEFSQTPEETSWLASSWVMSHISRSSLP